MQLAIEIERQIAPVVGRCQVIKSISFQAFRAVKVTYSAQRIDRPTQFSVLRDR